MESVSILTPSSRAGTTSRRRPGKGVRRPKFDFRTARDRGVADGPRGGAATRSAQPRAAPRPACAVAARATARAVVSANAPRQREQPSFCGTSSADRSARAAWPAPRGRAPTAARSAVARAAVAAAAARQDSGTSPRSRRRYVDRLLRQPCCCCCSGVHSLLPQRSRALWKCKSCGRGCQRSPLNDRYRSAAGGHVQNQALVLTARQELQVLQPWHSPRFTKGLDRHRAHRFGTPQHQPAGVRVHGCTQLPHALSASALHSPQTPSPRDDIERPQLKASAQPQGSAARRTPPNNNMAARRVLSLRGRGHEQAPAEPLHQQRGDLARGKRARARRGVPDHEGRVLADASLLAPRRRGVN